MCAACSRKSVMCRFSVAVTTALDAVLNAHLVRDDGDEDLAFVAWKPSTGRARQTAIITRVILPIDGERHVHGNVSFESSYFLRACREAAAAGGGVGLVHSHPTGRSWQGLSADDFEAESGHAAQATQLTGLPLIGLTLAGGTGVYSARVWHRTGPRQWEPQWADSVRVVGDHMRVSLPAGPNRYAERYQRRTIEAWGAETQQVIGSLKVAVVGAGSVGSQIVEALARTGFGALVILDYDAVEDHNLDRILNATRQDAAIAAAKAEVAATAATAHATHPAFTATWDDHSAVEREGLELLKDCDLIFSCVDRPAGRAALNALAYAHLIPVVDGGVRVTRGRTRMRGAEWRAHVAAPGRRCLECLGQFDPAMVQADRDGLLADSSYLDQLPEDDPLKRNENVYAFAAAVAAEQVLAALRMIVAPAGLADIGAQTFHLTSGTVDLDVRPCRPGCIYNEMTSAADAAGRPVGTRHIPAEDARQRRSQLKPVAPGSSQSLQRRIARHIRAWFTARRGRSDKHRCLR
jgi:molybdopterin-synthase adenylyltransferase